MADGAVERSMQFGVPNAIAALLRGLPSPWAFCGGWAIDLFLNRITRSHKDVDVAVFRHDQHLVRSYFTNCGWTAEKIVDGKLLPWNADEFIELPVPELWF